MRFSVEGPADGQHVKWSFITAAILTQTFKHIGQKTDICPPPQKGEDIIFETILDKVLDYFWN